MVGEVSASAENGAKVLIVEDDADLREIFSTFLGSKGYAVTDAGTAVEGVAMAREVRPDLIIMDLGLPDADGFSAARAICSDVALAGVPVLVVSAYDTMQFRAEAMEAGCTGYMVKPVDPEQLLMTLRLLTETNKVNQETREGGRDEGSGS